MPAEPRFINDELETLVRKCVVFPANGSQTCIVPMTARTVTSEDITSIGLHSRCVDMTRIYGDEYRKTQVTAFKNTQHGIQSTYLFFHNLSPNLPINLNVARVLGVTPSHLKTKRRLFWRGDVVAMKVQPQSETLDFMVETLDADLSELKDLEQFFQETFRKGSLERLLEYDEAQWKFYVSYYCKPTSVLLFGPPKSYWGENAARKEENFLRDLNELRCVIGRRPIPRPVHMKSYTEHAATLYNTVTTAFYNPKVTGPPKLPPQLERQIFETCALDSPEYCTTLLLVAKRVHAWIDPILLSTVCIMENFESRERDRPERFLARLTNGEPVEYYARHVKNLAIIGPLFQTEVMDRILAICTGVENLLLLAPARGFDFLKNPQAGRNLRRLSIRLENVSPRFDFYHPCFANLTHLHLSDDDEDWPYYAGWESLTSLTHLAFACSGPPQTVMQLMQILPTVRYVALGYYRSGEKYAEATVDNSPHIRAAWGVRIVFLSEIPEHDWERGARGEGDFWDLVEREVEKRLEDPMGSID